MQAVCNPRVVAAQGIHPSELPIAICTGWARGAKV
jgi:hypothetical protein